MKINNKKFTFTLLIFTLFYSVFSNALNIDVTDAYIRETLPGNQISSAYMKISNNNDHEILFIGASSSISSRIEIHQHSMKNGMMQMRQLKNIKINADENVLLQPYGLHLMIFNLQQPLKDGQKVQLTLHFAKQDDVIINVPVISIKKKRSPH